MRTVLAALVVLPYDLRVATPCAHAQASWTSPSQAPTRRWRGTCRTPESWPSASLMITHAGLDTTMVALGHDVPLPIGRDQFYNAERVQALRAGRMLMSEADSEAIALAAKGVLADSHFTAEAKRTADAIGGYGGAARAAEALEALV